MSIDLCLDGRKTSFRYPKFSPSRITYTDTFFLFYKELVCNLSYGQIEQNFTDTNFALYLVEQLPCTFLCEFLVLRS